VGSKLPPPIRVIWGDKEGECEDVSSADELDQVLDRIQGSADPQRPPIIDVEVPDHGLLRIGLTKHEAVLSVMSPSLEPPYFNSVGSDESGPHLIFSYRGHWTEFPARLAVPVESGREAANRFVSGEFLPANITWEET
jgi:hypothetical protein